MYVQRSEVLTAAYFGSREWSLKQQYQIRSENTELLHPLKDAPLVFYIESSIKEICFSLACL